jgi:hypothetical protein
MKSLCFWTLITGLALPGCAPHSDNCVDDMKDLSRRTFELGVEAGINEALIAENEHRKPTFENALCHTIKLAPGVAWLKK